MKISPKDPQALIRILVVVTVVGALLYRDYRMAGLVLTLCAVGFYLLFNTRSALRCAFRFRHIRGRQRLRLLTYVALLYIFIGGIVNNTIFYFLLLLVFAVDYLLYDNPVPRS